MCPDYFGAVTCSPVDALTRAILPGLAVGAAWGAILHPGPQYITPHHHAILRGAAAGAIFGTTVAVTAYIHKWTSCNNVAAAASAVMLLPAAFYGAWRLGAIPTA